jgi:membrane-associated protease RseP (regulator of RpoE activity)
LTAEPSPRLSERPAVLTPALLFVATLLSVFWTGAGLTTSGGTPTTFAEFASGWVYAVPLMAILTCHELGHYIAARIHGVPASLPYFLPLPVISPFGTLGAVISMPERIRSRNALLDIGAAGPIAGLVIALPVLVVGLSLSPVSDLRGQFYTQEGQSLLYWLVKRLVVGAIADGHDVELHPTAYAGWVGLFVTMINLLPWGQLDGGHIAYSLLGRLQNRIGHWVRRGVLLFFGFNLVKFVGPVTLGESNMPTSLAIGNSLPWLVWFGLLLLLGRTMGHDHPTYEPGELSPGRRRVAAACLVLFVLLFMPTPMASYTPDDDNGDGNFSRSALHTTSGA